ncbi:MAG: hypothetical protein U0Q55_15030 [Vicinamibacterales bacterium]
MANVVVPGPLRWVRVVVTVAPAGRPSSVTVPPSCAGVASVTVGGAVAVTVGALLTGGAGFTVIVASARHSARGVGGGDRSACVPGALKVAVVAAADAFANVVVPGPLRWVHVVVTVAPAGRPSSVTVPPS